MLARRAPNHQGRDDGSIILHGGLAPLPPIHCQSLSGTIAPASGFPHDHPLPHGARCGSLSREVGMDNVIYLVGLVVVVMFILSALGLR
jgi:hypothetical protein